MRQRGERLTIHDIASMAGVSAGTVSRTMNNQPGVGAATRQRILDLVQEQGFKMDAVARQLSTGRTRIIGIVFPLEVSEVVLHPVFPELLGSLGDAAQRADYDIMMFTVPSPEKAGHVLEAVSAKRVDGLVLPAAGAHDPLVRGLAELDAPTVLIGHRARSSSVGWIDCTHDLAAAELTRTMIRHGRRRLVMLNGPSHISACRLRSRGFWDAVESEGNGVSAEEIAVEMDASSGLAAALTLLTGDARPDGIVCASDAIASGVLDAARQLGVPVPEQLEVSGFDDSSWATHTTPQLTTVRMPLQETGVAAIELLIDLIEHEPAAAARHTILPTSIVWRGSTLHPPAD